MQRNKTRILLPNGCSMSTPSITPSNWNKAGASVSADWYIFYRFYDPSIAPGSPHCNGKQVMVKGINDYKSLSDRRAALKKILDNEMDALTNRGWNPITKTNSITVDQELSEKSRLAWALEEGWKKLSCDPQTKMDAKSVKKYALIAINELGYDDLPLSDTRRKHITRILEVCERNQNARAAGPKVKGLRVAVWGPDRHNKYLAYLSMLFNALGDVMELNPTAGIKKKKRVKTVRETLQATEMLEIGKLLKKESPRFWVYLNIFYPSGSRRAELLRLKGRNVNLEEQTFTRLIKKGGQYEEVKTTILDSTLPFWQEAMKGCKKDDYVFSAGLKPGPKMIRPEQVTRRWRTHVKNKLSITADCYSLKHLFTKRAYSRRN